MPQTTDLKHFIGNAFVSGGKLHTHKSPWTGKSFVCFPIGSSAEVNLAVETAQEALTEWKALGVQGRVGFVASMADWLVKEYGDEGQPTALKTLISEETGKPLPEADIEVIESSDFLRYFAENATETLSSQEAQLDEQLWASKKSELWYEPHGVVALIKPWNYPLEMIAWSLAPALLAGNTVVIKPSEKSSSVAAVYGRMAMELDLPAGVLNIVNGNGETGEALVRHKDVNYVSFTGSAKVGKQIGSVCGSEIKPCSLELSGNDAAIVLDDADIETTANGLVWGAFCNAGQVCVGIKRAFIHEQIYTQLVDRVVEKTEQLRLGKDIGPIVDAQQVKHVKSFLDDVGKTKAKLLAGGSIETQGGGTFVRPTVYEMSSTESVFMANECFGPLLPIWRVKDEKQAIELANRSQYGLGASVWTQSSDRARSLAHQLNVGMVWANDVNIAVPQGAWGGRKQSGFGYELTASVLKNYCRLKHYNYETSTDQTRAWWYPY